MVVDNGTQDRSMTMTRKPVLSADAALKVKFEEQNPG